MSAITTSNEEAELDSIFAEDVETGMSLMHDQFQEKILGYIKNVGCNNLSRQELLDIYQDTMIAMIEQVRKPTFNTKRPLRLAFQIARCRTIDHVRKKKSSERLIGLVGQQLVGTNTGEWWKVLTPAERTEVAQLIMDIVAKLPKQQRLIASAYINHYQEITERNTYKPLTSAVKAMTGEDMTVHSAKRAWAAARQQIKDSLVKSGYSTGGW